MKQQVKCKFDFLSMGEDIYIEFSYACTVENKTILKNAELEFIGDHKNEDSDSGENSANIMFDLQSNNSNVDVVAIIFRDCVISKIPQGLTKIFPNLIILYITNSKLKHVRREDFKDLTKLTRLRLERNEIEFLPGDLFADMKDLYSINFSNNKIKMIESGLFDGLENLNKFDLSENPGIDKFFDSCNSNGTIEEIKQEIRDKYWKKISKHHGGISDDFKCIVQNENLKDFTVKIEGEEFKVHKLILAARSLTILAMIKSNAGATSLNIDDISSQTFRDILNFIYTDELPESNGYFVDLFIAADKLKINKLQDLCADNLIEKINAENAFEILALANKYEHQKLKRKSFEDIKKILDDDDIDEELANHPDLLKEAFKCKKEIDKNAATMSDILKNSRKRKSECISK